MATHEPIWAIDDLAHPHDTPDKASRIRRMFNSIARRYELVNTVFSFGRDGAWRRKAVALCAAGPDDDVLDIACGTGDFARAFARAHARFVAGCDFAHEMLIRARDDHPTVWSRCESDALRLPFAKNSFSVVSCAFGVRNFADLRTGLREMHRVLQPGGRAVILEFTTPRSRVVRALNNVYAQRFMPIAASLLSRDRTGAYRYLPKSVVSFGGAQRMREEMEAAGFGRITIKPLSMGIVTVYVGWRE